MYQQLNAETVSNKMYHGTSQSQTLTSTVAEHVEIVPKFRWTNNMLLLETFTHCWKVT